MPPALTVHRPPRCPLALSRPGRARSPRRAAARRLPSGPRSPARRACTGTTSPSTGSTTSPGRLDGVLAREQPPLAGQRRADQPVVGPHVRPPAARRRSAPRAAAASPGPASCRPGCSADLGVGVDPEPQGVAHAAASARPNTSCGGRRNRNDTSVAVTGRHLPARIRIGTSAQRQESARGPERRRTSRSCDFGSTPSTSQVAVVLAADDGGRRRAAPAPPMMPRLRRRARSPGRSRPAGRPARWPAPGACGSAPRPGWRRSCRRSGRGRRRRTPRAIVIWMLCTCVRLSSGSMIEFANRTNSRLSTGSRPEPVVDPVDGVLAEVLVHRLVELLRAGQVGAERLLHHHPRALARGRPWRCPRRCGRTAAAAPPGSTGPAGRSPMASDMAW